jgi:CDP-glucose 4,6-dehydratase
VLESAEQPHEASNLLLDSEKARKSLGWSDKLDFVKSIEWTVNWYKTNIQESSLEITKNQIQDFFNLGQEE